MDGLSEYEMKLSVVLPLCKVKRVPGRWEEKCCWEKKSGVELKNNRTLKLVRKKCKEARGGGNWRTEEETVNNTGAKHEYFTSSLFFSHTHTFTYTHIKYIDNIGKK